MSLSNALLSRFQNQPTLVEPGRQAWFESCIQLADSELGRIQGLAHAAGESLTMQDGDWWGVDGSFLAYVRPYVVRDGVLQIPVKGVLLNDFPYALGSWATGYEYIWKAFQRGLSDENVKGIALIIDSPGGMVAGNFDLVDKMYEARGTKPVRAFAHESAYSAAYSIASVADLGGITVSRTGGVGSIGVVTSHVDVSAAMANDGYKITFIYAGEHKVDGNRYEALPPKVKERIQAEINAVYDVFVQTVARNRELDEQAVRDTEAQTFMPPEALSNGLADKIGALDDSLAEYSVFLNLDEDEGTTLMTDFTQAQLDAAVSEATLTATAAGATAAKDRITAILGCEAAKERPTAALSAALDTDMTADQASTFLAKLPVEQKATAEAPPKDDTKKGAGAPDGMFKAAMNGSANPDIVASTDGEDGDQQMSTVDAIFGSVGRDHPKAA